MAIAVIRTTVVRPIVGAPGEPSRPAPVLANRGVSNRSGEQAGGGGGFRERELLREEHDRDHGWGRADGFEQADSFRLFGHPPAGEDADTGQGEGEQPARRLQGRPARSR